MDTPAPVTDLLSVHAHAAGDKAVGITSMATLDAAPQFGAELKVLFVWDNCLLV